MIIHHFGGPPGHRTNAVELPSVYIGQPSDSYYQEYYSCRMVRERVRHTYRNLRQQHKLPTYVARQVCWDMVFSVHMLHDITGATRFVSADDRVRANFARELAATCS